MGSHKSFTIKYKAVATSKRGVTLIELIMVLALMAIVFTSIFSFYSFNLGIFGRAQNKSDIQHDVLLVSEFITKEVRTATGISLSSRPPQDNDKESYNSFIGLYQDGVEYHYDKGYRQIANTNIMDLNLVLSPNSNLLKFHITGEKDGEEYRIDSNVSLPNLADMTDEEISGSWIYYNKP
ncbi:MAG TPA: prepilin-type N-terminal cleavage/methylation domain-containing protein [Clostridia bacterium]|nr:prepilin-type N-terminal cleavage/methylation domain-containing protein [Clostridia bacterium]